MKMKLMKNKKYLQQENSRKVLVPKTTADFTSRASKSYVPFTCKFPMVMYFVRILHKHCRSKSNFYVFSYDKTIFKFCASLRFFLAAFMEKFQKLRYLNHVRKGIASQHTQFTSISSPDIFILTSMHFGIDCYVNIFVHTAHCY